MNYYQFSKNKSKYTLNHWCLWSFIHLTLIRCKENILPYILSIFLWNKIKYFYFYPKEEFFIKKSVKKYIFYTLKYILKLKSALILNRENTNKLIIKKVFNNILQLCMYKIFRLYLHNFYVSIFESKQQIKMKNK